MKLIESILQEKNPYFTVFEYSIVLLIKGKVYSSLRKIDKESREDVHLIFKHEKKNVKMQFFSWYALKNI